MIVTLDAFSGRLNPSWRLSAKDTARLLERVSGHTLTAATGSGVEAVLGFRGFIVTASSDDESDEGVPYEFRIGGPMPTQAPATEPSASALSTTESAEVSRFLLNTGRHVLDAELMASLESAIQTSAQPKPEFDMSQWMEPAEPAEEGEEREPPAETSAAQAVAETGVSLAPCVIANTAYNPGFWNQPGVQGKNNCYNYAMNWRSDTFAQPGRISGHPTTVVNCAAIGTAADWDGCHAYCSGSNKSVALVFAPKFFGNGPDYHWYRRQKEGFWAHKPGGGAVTNKDNSGRIIDGSLLTPANCNRGDYTVFCGYRFSPTGMRVR